MTLNVEEIRAAMKTNRIDTYKTLASLIGVSYATVKRQLTGGEAPSAVVLAGIHSRLGLKLDRVVIVYDPEMQKRDRAA